MQVEPEVEFKKLRDCEFGSFFFNSQGLGMHIRPLHLEDHSEGHAILFCDKVHPLVVPQENDVPVAVLTTKPSFVYGVFDDTILLPSSEAAENGCLYRTETSGSYIGVRWKSNVLYFDLTTGEAKPSIMGVKLRCSKWVLSFEHGRDLLTMSFSRRAIADMLQGRG